MTSTVATRIEQVCDNGRDARREWDSTVDAEIVYHRSAPAVPAIPGAVGASHFIEDRR